MKRFFLALWPLYFALAICLCFVTQGRTQVSGWPWPFTSFSPLTIGIPNNTPIDLKNGSGVNENAIVVDSSNNLVLATGLASVTAGNNVPVRLGSNGLSFEYGGDLSLTHSPRSTWCASLSSLANGNSKTFGGMETETAIHIRNAVITTPTAPQSCSTSPTFSVVDTASGTVAGTGVNLANTNPLEQISGLNIAIAGNRLLQVQDTTAMVGCSAVLSDLQYCVTYTTD